MTITYSTLLIPLAAGVAAMLAFQTRASAGVGVAISVTTIPAAAYLGVAFGVGNALWARRSLALSGAKLEPLGIDIGAAMGWAA